MDVVDLRGVRFFTYNNDILVRDDRHEHDVSSGLRCAIGGKDVRFLMREQATAAWVQLFISQIFSGATLLAPLVEFGLIPQVTRFCFPSAFAIPNICRTCYFAVTVLYLADSLVASPCNTTFALLLDKKYYFVSFQVLLLNALPESEYDRWKSQL